MIFLKHAKWRPIMINGFEALSNLHLSRLCHSKVSRKESNLKKSNILCQPEEEVGQPHVKKEMQCNKIDTRSIKWSDGIRPDLGIRHKSAIRPKSLFFFFGIGPNIIKNLDQK